MARTTRREAWRATARLIGDTVRSLRGDTSADLSADARQRRSEVMRSLLRMTGTMTRGELRGLLASKATRKRLREEAAVQAAADVARTMGNMKGLAMKFGQFASFSGGLSDSTEAELAALQVMGEPMDFDVVYAILEAELGSNPLRRFASFEREPIAAASVGQVHRARLHDGREAVVKVQYPGIEQAIMADFDSVADMSRAWALTGVKFDVEAILTDLGAMLKDEFDYEREAKSQEHFAALYRNHPYVVIPEVVPDLSSRRILTSEYVDGRRFYEVSGRPQAELDRFGEIIYRFAFGSIASGVFSCDPHPGNYLFLDDGRVCFLDFGLVERTSVEDLAAMAAPVAAAIADDWDGLVKGLHGLGMLPDDGGNPERLWAEIGMLLAGPVDRDEPVRLDPREIGRQIMASQKPNAEFYKCRKASYQPPWLSMLMRYTMGTVAVLGKFRAEANWHALAGELFLGDPPSTEIGRRWWSSLPSDARVRPPVEQPKRRPSGPRISSRVAAAGVAEVQVGGFVAPGFEPVRQAFVENFEQRAEVGAAFTVYHRGRPVVDLWGGTADADSGAPWVADTVAVMDSATKAVTAICALTLIEDGELDLDAPVADYWPEFAAEGKGDITVATVMANQAGLPAIDRWLTLDMCEAWHPIPDALAAQQPLWEPGTAHGYHGLTIGWLTGEIVRRVSGLTPGQFVAQRIAPRLGLDLWIGVPTEVVPRVAPVTRIDLDNPDALMTDYGDEAYNEFMHELTAQFMDPEWLEMYRDPSKRTDEFFKRDLTIGQRAFATTEVGDDMNAPRYLQMEVPAANGIADARSVARLYASLIGDVDGVRLISPELMRRVSTVHSIGPDMVLRGKTAWGLGFAVDGGVLFQPPTPTCFGHPGANGTQGFADPARGVAVGYVRNNMSHRIPDERSTPLIETAFACLEAITS